MTAMTASDVVRILPDGTLELICPNCGRTKRLTGAESVGNATTTCPSPTCDFSRRLNWHEWLRRHAVQK